MSSRFFSSLPALVLGLTLSACLQANGETCQIDGDCTSGNCCKTSTSADARGVCEATGAACLMGVDAGMTQDAGTDAAVEDAGDAAAEDAGTDGGGEDGGTEDAGSDAGTDASTPDAGTDAGADAGDAGDAV